MNCRLKKNCERTKYGSVDIFRCQYLQLAVLVNIIFRRLIQRVIHFHNRRLVATSVAIVGRRKDRHHGSVVLPLVAFHYQLMCASDEVQTVNVRELLGNVLSKRVASAPRRDAPSTTVSKRP